MVNKARNVETGTLETGTLTMQVFANGPSEVELSGTFGSVVLSTSTAPGVAERTITAGERFESEMQDMLFTLTTGTGPVVVNIRPFAGTNYIATELS